MQHERGVGNNRKLEDVALDGCVLRANDRDRRSGCVGVLGLSKAADRPSHPFFDSPTAEQERPLGDKT